VAAIRAALDAAGSADVAVAGVVKYASALYGPYRVAVGMAHVSERAVPLVPLGDAVAARAAGAAALAEGADLIVVKPGLVALDTVAALVRLGAPIAAQHSAGEHVMLRASEESGLDAYALAAEAVLASRRAGAALVVSFDAIAAAELLSEAAT
jgi:porphobilinogen synthase